MHTARVLPPEGFEHSKVHLVCFFTGRTTKSTFSRQKQTKKTLRLIHSILPSFTVFVLCTWCIFYQLIRERSLQTWSIKFSCKILLYILNWCNWLQLNLIQTKCELKIKHTNMMVKAFGQRLCRKYSQHRIIQPHCMIRPFPLGSLHWLLCVESNSKFDQKYADSEVNYLKSIHSERLRLWLTLTLKIGASPICDLAISINRKH